MYILISYGAISIEFLITDILICIRESGFMCELQLPFPDWATDHVWKQQPPKATHTTGNGAPLVHEEQAGHSASLPKPAYRLFFPLCPPFLLSCLLSFSPFLLPFLPPSFFLIFLPPLSSTCLTHSFLPLRHFHPVVLCCLNTGAKGSALPKNLLSSINTLTFP